MSDELVIPPRHELPIWMQQSMQGVDWGVLTVIAFCLLIGWHVIRTPQIVPGDQTEHFLYLADEFSNSIEEGILYPHWSSQSLQGFGAPIPHFYPPAIPYAIALLRLIVTNDAIVALKVLYIILTILIGTTVYAILTRRATARAGIIAALLLTTSPYVSLTLAHSTGNIASYAGIALFCAQIWAINRMLSASSPADLLALSGCTALGLLTAPFYALAGVFCAVILSAVRFRQAGGWSVWRGLTALLLGIAIAACFWLPAWLDAHATAWIAVQQETDTTVMPHMLIAPHQMLDPAALNHLPQYHPGIPILLLNGIGLAAYLRQRRSWKQPAAAAITVLILTVLAITTGNEGLFGLLTILLAWSAGATSDHWLQGKHSAVLLAVSAGAIYWSVAPIYSVLPASSITYNSTFSEYEIAGYGLAALPDGMNLPVSERVLDFIAADPEPDKRFINPQPALAQIRLIEERIQYALLEINTTESVRIVYKYSYFAGWSASLNGSTLPVTEDERTGLLAIQLPANSQGILTLTLQDTFWQKIAWGITVAGLLLVCTLTIRFFRSERPRYYFPALLNSAETRLLWIIFGMAVTFSVFVPPGTLHQVSHPPASGLTSASSIDAVLQLLDVQLPRLAVDRQGILTMQLLWRVTSTPDYQIPMRIRLINHETPAISIASSVAHPANLPVNRWLPDLTVTDERRLSIPADAVPGTYQIVVESYRCTPVCGILTPDRQFPAEITRSITLAEMIEIR
jgi:hypothetical protein